MRRSRLAITPLLLALAACSPSLPVQPDRPASRSSPATTATPAGALAATAAGDHPGLAGFELLTDGSAAFTARYGLALLAQREIDVQYYIWEGDTSGRLLAAALLAAAERGVRVRVLMDDIHTGGRDFNIAALDAHPNIEVRTFNPFTRRQARTLNLVTDFTRLNHRMHNKLFLVDGAVAIVGGRNIGDDYFGLSPAVNFRDLDLLAAGPVVGDLAASFDEYWNSDWAFPITALAGDVPSPERAAEERARLAAGAAAQADFPYPLPATAADAEANLRTTLASMLWGPATVLADSPDKPAGNGASGVMAALRPAVAGLQSELLIESAYFIPTEQGVANLCGLTGRGIHVRVLTNSLASNDLLPGHAGYSRYREGLLRCGVELHEFRPDATVGRSGWSPRAADARASLHTKAIVLDESAVFIGSLNLNPRSVELNTEIGVLIRSPALAREIARFMATGVTPADAWQVYLATADGRASQLVWVDASDEARPVVVTTEPDTSGWRRFSAWFIAQLPVEQAL